MIIIIITSSKSFRMLLKSHFMMERPKFGYSMRSISVTSERSNLLGPIEKIRMIITWLLKEFGNVSRFEWKLYKNRNIYKFDNQRTAPQINELETFKNDLLDVFLVNTFINNTRLKLTNN